MTDRRGAAQRPATGSGRSVQPLACRNVPLTSANIASLTCRRTHLEQAPHPAGLIAPFVRHRLEQQLGEVTGFLSSHDLRQAGQA